MKYVIEHLEPEVFDWCLIEYRHISQVVGKKNLIFTNVKKGMKGAGKLKDLGEVKFESVQELALKNACVLDPDSKKMLTPADAKFDFMIFGGILGDDPPRARTKAELTSKVKFETRNMGEKQMSTDTAVFVAKKIVDGTRFEDIKFQDGIELVLGEHESVYLPYRYVIEDSKIVLPDRFIEFLNEREEF